MGSEEFSVWVQDVKVQYHFRKLGLEVNPKDSRTLFNLLDMDRTGMLDFDKFAIGVEQLRGQVRSLDIARVRLDCKKLEKQVIKVKNLCEERVLATHSAPYGTATTSTIQSANGRRPVAEALSGAFGGQNGLSNGQV